MKKIEYIIVGVLQGQGEIEIGENDHHNIFIKAPVKIVPIIILMGDEQLTEEQRMAAKSMALHQVVNQALKQVTPNDIEIIDTNTITNEGPKN